MQNKALFQPFNVGCERFNGVIELFEMQEHYSLILIKLRKEKKMQCNLLPPYFVCCITMYLFAEWSLKTMNSEKILE